MCLLKMASLIHQNIKVKVKELIHPFLTGRLQTFHWIHFLKEIVVCSNFFLYFTPYNQNRKHICDFHRFYAQKLVCKKRPQSFDGIYFFSFNRFKTSDFYN